MTIQQEIRRIPLAIKDSLDAAVVNRSPKEGAAFAEGVADGILTKFGKDELMIENYPRDRELALYLHGVLAVIKIRSYSPSLYEESYSPRTQDWHPWEGHTQDE